MIFKTTTTMLAFAMVLSGAAAHAHEGVGPHGGRLADTPKYHVELVVTNDTVDVFLSDKASKPVPATGLTGLAIIVTGGASARIVLAGDGAKLSGKTTSKLPDIAKSVVQVKLGDGQTIQASFD